MVDRHLVDQLIVVLTFIEGGKGRLAALPLSFRLDCMRLTVTNEIAYCATL